MYSLIACCPTLNVTLYNDVKDKYANFEGVYTFQGFSDGMDYWVDTSDQNAIWYSPYHIECGSNNCPASLGFNSEIDCCSSTQIMSPNYPNSYPNNAEETWLIAAPNGSIITLQFHSFHVRLILKFENTIST